MSYPGVEPADVQTMNPVGTQGHSAGSPDHNDFEAEVERRLRERLDSLSQTVQEEVAGTVAAQKEAVTTLQSSFEAEAAPAPKFNKEELESLVADAVQSQFAVTNGWKQGHNIKFVVECPSGQRCLVKHLDTMDLVQADLVEDMDFFTKALFPSSGGGATDKGFWQALRDPDRQLKFFTLLNKLVEVAVINPVVVDDGCSIIEDENRGRVVVLGTSVTSHNGVDYISRNGVQRQLRPEEVRASFIDFTDKMAIFAELNKPLELIQPFREEPSAGLENLDREQGASSSA